MEARKREILRAVVQEFTTNAVPVGSSVLAHRHFLTLSSATIRHELSSLSDLGYLIQPHTSAGRIPSDQGYRYFVDFLMGTEPIPRSLRDFIDGQIRSTPPDVQALVERIAMVVANVTQNASVVTAPHGPMARVKHLDLVCLDPHTVLLILLLDGNVLRQQLIEVPVRIDQETLTRLARRLLPELAGRDRDAVTARLGGEPKGAEGDVLRRIHDLLEQYELGSETLVVHDGVRNLVKQPEFSNANRLQEVLEILEESRHLSTLLREIIGESDLEIVIGSENTAEQLRSCTVILTTYGPARRVKGTLGVVGPTRIRYGQTLARLGAVARAATARMQDLVA